jgi:hypothetical protein
MSWGKGAIHNDGYYFSSIFCGAIYKDKVVYKKTDYLGSVLVMKSFKGFEISLS